jgi:uncharacterized membrane protein
LTKGVRSENRQHEDVFPLVNSVVSNKEHRRLIFLRLHLATLVVFLPFDALWIALVMKPLFLHHVGDLLADQMHVAAALGFYASYVAGIIYFAAWPAWRGDSWRSAAINGGILGLCTYGTYEVTNMATLRGWSWKLVVTDVAWGALLTGVSAAVGFKMVRSFSSNAPSS